MTQFLRFRDVEKITGLSRATLYRRIASGELSPPIPLGSSTHVVGFEADKVEEFCKRCIERSVGEPAAA
jgi:predicted DNA-binding transcriptional regulator AlpA